MKVKEIIEEYFKTNLLEMSNYHDVDTGLTSGTILWVRVEPEALEHIKYRIKVSHPQNGSAVFRVWNDKIRQVAGDWKLTGKGLKKILLLVSLTRIEIVNHIDGKISSAALGRVFDKVRLQVERI